MVILSFICNNISVKNKESKKKILIIKTGHSEVFTELTSGPIVSLGDVLRSGCILESLCDYDITWFTSSEALPLLKIFYPHINLVTSQSAIDIFNFELIINLEKDFSFLKDLEKVKFSGIQKDGNFLNIFLKSNDHQLLNNDNIVFEEKLNKLLGVSYRKSESDECDLKLPINAIVGLNYQVGKKWPEKMLDEVFWSKLDKKLGDNNIRVSWQKGFNNISEYVTWISSCSHIVTLDSLGLHIANQLKKSTYAIFGPTSIEQISLAFGKKYNQYKFNEDELINEITKDIMETLNGLE